MRVCASMIAAASRGVTEQGCGFRKATVLALLTYQLRANLRGRWRSHLAVVVLLGVLGGLSLFALAGARRTQSAYSRFVKSSDVSTMAVDAGYNPKLSRAVAKFPEVARSSAYVSFNAVEMSRGRPTGPLRFEAVGSVDGRFFGQDRFAPTSGRLPDPSRADEVAVNKYAAKRYGYHVGGRVDVGVFTDQQVYDPAFRARNPPPKVRSAVTVVGIGVFPADVLQDETEAGAQILFTPPFTAQVKPYITYAWQGLVLKRGDHDVDAVKRRILHLLPPGTPQYFQVTSATTYHSLQAMRPLSIALGLFGLISGLSAIVLVGQALARLIRLERDEQAALRAFGASPSSICRSTMAPLIVTIVVGTGLAIAFAIAASPAMPIGRVRLVEPSPGVNVDAAALGVAGLALIAALVAIAFVVVWRELPHKLMNRRPARPSPIVSFAARRRMSPSAVAGLRLAFERSDDGNSVQTRSVMVGMAIAIAALVASLTFGSSLRSLTDTPRLFGWNWDATLLDTQGYGNTKPDQAHTILDRDQAVESWSGAYFGSDQINARNVPLMGMAPSSTVSPPLLEGHQITNANEVVLGPTTAAQLHKHVGDVVSLGSSNQLESMRIVGIAIFPSIGIIHGAHTSLGVGALVAPERVPGSDLNITNTHTHGPNAIFIRFKPDTDKAATTTRLRRVVQAIGGSPGAAALVPVLRPAEIANSSDVGDSPSLLAGVLAIGALASLAVSLITSIRRRRHHLAVLKALGFTPRQVAATIVWQATSTITIGLVIGIPVGIAVGNSLWTLFAHQLDVVPATAFPARALLILVLATLALANIVAALPAAAARRAQPAVALRTP